MRLYVLVKDYGSEGLVVCGGSTLKRAALVWTLGDWSNKVIEVDSEGPIIPGGLPFWIKEVRAKRAVAAQSEGGSNASE